MAARFCPQCGQEVSSTAKFCPNCAAPLTAIGTAPSVTTHPLDAATQKSRSLLLPAAIAAVVVLAVALGLLANSRRQASLLVSPPPAVLTAPAVTNAPAQAPVTAPPLTNAPAQTPMTGPAVTNAPDKPAPSLPPDVAAYLNFLGGIEQKRVAMNNDTSQLMGTLTTATDFQSQQMQASASPDDDTGPQSGAADTKQSTLKKIGQAYTDQVLKWQALTREFRATPPPPSCTLLANHYYTFLTDYTTIASKMQVALLNLDPNGISEANLMTTATQAQGTASADGAAADTALSDLCTHYGVPKPFVIAPEGAAPSLLGH